MRRQAVSCGAVVAVLFVAPEIGAHHGAGIYDPGQTVTVSGAVTQFQFVNPHVLIYIATTDADGREVVWSGELTSPNRLARLASGGVKWHKDLLKPGDVITLTGNPARNGAPALLLNRVLDADGNVLTATGR